MLGKKIIVVLVIFFLLAFLTPTTFIGLGGLVPVARDGTWQFAGVALFRDLWSAWKEWRHSKKNPLVFIILLPFSILVTVLKNVLIVPTALFSWALYGMLMVWAGTHPVRVWIWGRMVSIRQEGRAVPLTEGNLTIANAWNSFVEWDPTVLYREHRVATTDSGTEFCTVPISPEGTEHGDTEPVDATPARGNPEEELSNEGLMTPRAPSPTGSDASWKRRGIIGLSGIANRIRPSLNRGPKDERKGV